MEVDERARAGLFLAMQYQAEIVGVTNAEFMRSAINARREEDDKMGVREFIKKLDEKWPFRYARRNGRTLFKRRILRWGKET